MLPFFGRNDTIFSYTHCYWPIFTIFNFRFVIPFFWNIFTLFSKNHGNCPSITILILWIYIIWFLRNLIKYSLLNKIGISFFIFHIIIVPFIWNWKFIIFKIICYSKIIIIFNVRIMIPLFWWNYTMLS